MPVYPGAPPAWIRTTIHGLPAPAEESPEAMDFRKAHSVAQCNGQAYTWRDPSFVRQMLRCAVTWLGFVLTLACHASSKRAFWAATRGHGGSRLGRDELRLR